MKKLLITVEEFFENGGEIQIGRELFQNAYPFNKVGDFAGLATLDSEMILVKQSTKSIRLYSSLVMILVDCKPIYK